MYVYQMRFEKVESLVDGHSLYNVSECPALALEYHKYSLVPYHLVICTLKAM